TKADPDMLELRELFDVEYGNKLDMNKQAADPNGICFVGRKGTSQGISGRVREMPGVKKYPASTVTVALGGAVLATYVQQEPYYTAQNVAVLPPRRIVTTGELLWWSHLIHATACRYTAVGREANRTLSSLLLPTAIPQYVSRVIESAR